MVSLPNFICFCTLLLLIKTIQSQQTYDGSSCSKESPDSGSNYLCASKSHCDTYVVYRAQKNFESLSSTSYLFRLSINELLSANNMTEDDPSSIPVGQEIIIPIKCSCAGKVSKSIVMYNYSSSDSFPNVACGVFEGLVKAQNLVEENPVSESGDRAEFPIKVPIRCACPKKNDTRNGVNFLVTYPIVENDNVSLIARKFGVPEKSILEANGLEQFAAIFPKTTLLIPTNNVSVLNWDMKIDHPAPNPREVIPVKTVASSTKATIRKLGVFIGLGVALTVILMIAACCNCKCIRRKNHPSSFQPLSARSSVSSNLSPDFLDGVSKLKHLLINFSLEELRIATESFNEASLVGKAVYRGRIDGSYVAIEHMDSEEVARNVVCILTKINHLNVARLEGCCYEKTPYLVFEFAENGSLRDCLSNAKMSRQLNWEKRMQIAFDVAVAIYYIHYCTKPAYVHRNINSRNVLVTKDWRAKISGFRLAKPVICSDEKEELNWNESVVGNKGYMAPEYESEGLASLKVDVFAYGVVLLELLSAKEVTTEGKLLKDSVNFLVDTGFEGSSGYLDELKKFLDPTLEGAYPLADAICLTFLGKACIEEDPYHRPTMNDVLKAISRMFYVY